MTTPDRVRREVLTGLEGLVARHGLPGETVPRLERVLWALVDDPWAPTTIREPLRVVEDHLADSLVALELEPVRSAGSLVDLGSGAGLPGVALAIALPEARVALVESAARRCAFLERLTVTAPTENATVEPVRAESWPDGIGRFDLATARALAPLDVVAEYAAPLLRRDGVLIVWRGRRDPDEELAAARAAAILGLSAPETVSVQPYSGARDRHLTLMLKEVETPEGFPRRPGMARKRPLGGPPRRSRARTQVSHDARSARDV